MRFLDKALESKMLLINPLIPACSINYLKILPKITFSQ
jgi:hypothetical protein